MPTDEHDPGPDTSPVTKALDASAMTDGNAARPAKKVAKIMVYTHPKVARKIKEIAFTTERKANDVILEALDLYFAKKGLTGIKNVIEN
jgi:hypothetical protein